MKINITRQHLKVYIAESSSRAHRNNKEYLLYGDVLVLVKDKVSKEIDLPACLQEIERRIPKHLIYGLDSIMIGTFTEFAERNINAFYRDGAIYVSNIQDDNEDFIDDIIHEIAHLVEKTYGAIIHQDQKMTREFLGKRQRLFYLLKAENFDVVPKDFMETEYSEEFDRFLFEEVGYPILTQLTLGLFLTPYGATSLSEYFAENFEFYFLKDREYVRKIAPASYEKIEELREVER